MKLAWEISHGFTAGSLDLGARTNPPAVGWDSLPETIMAAEFHALGESDAFVRLSTTFVAAMDRARDADELWRRAVRLYRQARWVYDIDEVVTRSVSDLADALLTAGVSQRHLGDSAAWRRIGESLRASPADAPVRQVIESSRGSAVRLLEDLGTRTPAGSARFPYLGGPKVGPMWVRMMAQPGNATISEMDVIPVAVDVRVRLVTEMLGVTNTGSIDLEQARGLIQDAWQQRCRDEGVDAPGALMNTTAGLDPALWIFAKWGCSYCRPRGHRVPISPACASCRLPEEPPRVAPDATRQGQRSEHEAPLIGLVGCVKTKLDHAAPARDLYTSPLFRDRRAAVDGKADRWFVISAEHGLLDPDQVIEPYDRTLADMSIPSRRAWSAKVLSALRGTLGDLNRYRFEIHAGADYFGFGLADGLRESGAEVSIPTQGLRQGEQRQLYARGTSPQVGASTPAGMTGGRWGRVADLLDSRGGNEVRLTFDEIADFIGAPLPPSARTYAAWWHSQSWVRYWNTRGWRATPKFRESAVVFTRVSS